MCDVGDLLFAMMSGLRSVRDKTLYLDERRQASQPYDRLRKISNLFGEALRQVRAEERTSLLASGHALYDRQSLETNHHGVPR